MSSVWPCLVTAGYLLQAIYLREFILEKAGLQNNGEAADGMDGLYWQFVERHVEQLSANPRTKRIQVESIKG